MSFPGKRLTDSQIVKECEIKRICNEANLLKKANLELCQKMASEIVLLTLSEDKEIHIKQSCYGSIYITICHNCKVIRISDHEIDTVNYDMQIIINKSRQDSIDIEKIYDVIY